MSSPVDTCADTWFFYEVVLPSPVLVGFFGMMPAQSGMIYAAGRAVTNNLVIHWLYSYGSYALNAIYAQ
jgi:hypothetical protein